VHERRRGPRRGGDAAWVRGRDPARGGAGPPGRGGDVTGRCRVRLCRPTAYLPRDRPRERGGPVRRSGSDGGSGRRAEPGRQGRSRVLGGAGGQGLPPALVLGVRDRSQERRARLRRSVARRPVRAGGGASVSARHGGGAARGCSHAGPRGDRGGSGRSLDHAIAGLRGRVRLGRGMALLRDGMPVAEVAADLGYFDHAHLTRRATQVLGVPPSAFRSPDRAPMSKRSP
jgi:hypothetical protein